MLALFTGPWSGFCHRRYGRVSVEEASSAWIVLTEFCMLNHVFYSTVPWRSLPRLLVFMLILTQTYQVIAVYRPEHFGKHSDLLNGIYYV